MHTSSTFRTLYWCTFMSLIVIARLLLYFVVRRELQRRGIDHVLAANKAAAEYKRVCIDEHKPLTVWYILMALLWLIPVMIIGWFILLWH